MSEPWHCRQLPAVVDGQPSPVVVCERERLTAERDAARDEVTRLREALVEIIDTRPCEWYGRHCITHGEKRPCSHGDAQALLAPPTDQGEGT